MSFATPLFLWFFLPGVLLAYWLLPTRCRNTNLAITSLVFYALGAKAWVWLLIAMIAGNFAAGLLLAYAKRQSDRAANVLLGVVVALNLAALGLWKYAGFLTRELNGVLESIGWHVPLVNLALPLGVSFFTFHCISYVVDIRRGTREPLSNPVDFTAYISQFPQLVAGPIIRFHEIADQLGETGRDRLSDFAAGFPRFALGLSKKVIIADSVAMIADTSFALPSSQLGWQAAWLGAIAYTVQIYFDFSGYSDMAIGLGRMFGFTFPENFNRPYSAVSVTDFWRRWHMSLSNWFRDYLYIPIGGNRSGPLRTYRNLIIVFFLTGLWHGANWTFIVWGLYHGALLIIERRTGIAKVKRRGLVPLRRFMTLLAVIVGWVLFRAENLTRAWIYLKAMFVPHMEAVPNEIEAALTHGRIFWLVIGTMSVLLSASFVMGRVVELSRSRTAMFARFAIVALITPYAALLVASGTFSPFLYFQF